MDTNDDVMKQQASTNNKLLREKKMRCESKPRVIAVIEIQKKIKFLDH